MRRYNPPPPGGVPERPKGTGCKPVGSAYGGSNPPAPTTSFWRLLQPGCSATWLRGLATRRVGSLGPLERATERRHEVAYGIVHQFPGGTKEQYEASIAAAHPSDGSLPDGQTFHIAGPSADGWTIVAVHESQESWERFRDAVLMPRMSEGIEGGVAPPPQET